MGQVKARGSFLCTFPSACGVHGRRNVFFPFGCEWSNPDVAMIRRMYDATEQF